MSFQDVRPGAYSLKAGAGQTHRVVFTFTDADESPSDLSAGVTVWLGGTTRDLDDFTDADAVAATVDENVATVDIDVPEGSSSTPLRVAVGDACVLVGKLYPSTTGANNPDADVAVRTADESNVAVSVLGVIATEEGGGGGGAPTDAPYLTTTAVSGLSAEVVVGATPQGELGGTWASPTVDTVHSGSSHASVQAAAEATAAAALAAHAAASDPHPGYLTPAEGNAAYQPLDGDLTALAAAGNAAVLAATTAAFLTADETKLDGIEAGAEVNDTAAEILAKLVTVDGSGSGLDADLLDGQSSAAFETPAGAQTKVDTHAADTTSVHGIADTSDLVLDGDARLDPEAFVWDPVAEEYVEHGRIFAGPNDPSGEGYTLAAGDVWLDPADIGGQVDSVAAGTGIDVDATDPTAPIVSIESGVYRSGGTDVAVADGGTGSSTAGGARTNLGLVIGTDVAAASEPIAAAHISDTSAAHAASAVSADSTTLVGTGTDVQAVLEELDNGIADHLADSSAAHAASAVSFSPTGTIAATDVQAAIAEVASEATGGANLATIYAFGG